MSEMEAAIFNDALSLPFEMRAELVDRLVESLHQAPSPEIDAAWEEVFVRRAEELISGKVKGIPLDEVFPRLRERLGQ